MVRGEASDSVRVASDARGVRWVQAATVLMACVAAAAVARRIWVYHRGWTPEQRDLLQSMVLDALGPPLADASNRFADDPSAAELGARLFRDARLSRTGAVSCATCHDPKRYFTDGRVLAQGIATTRRHTPSVVASAYGRWFFWDGRRDSQWAQALAPLETPAEQGASRTHVAGVVASAYRAEYEGVFGELPPMGDAQRFPPRATPLGDDGARAAWGAMVESDRDAVNRVFANVGKALSAYQRTLRFAPSRFDRYVANVLEGKTPDASATFTEQEQQGLRLFIGEARCVTCHTGPLLTSHNFFSVGVPAGASGDDVGRGEAFDAVEQDPFNCLGKYSDAPPEACIELRFMAPDSKEFLGAFKVPSLRGVAETAPYMHAGQFESLERVLQHYSDAPRPEPPRHSDVRPLALTDEQRASLVAFLGTLTSPIADPLGAPLDD